VAEGVAQAALGAVAASLPVELQARLAGTPQPSANQVRFLTRIWDVL